MFDHFRHAGAQMGQRKRLQQRRIDQYRARLMKGAHEILPGGCVYTHLAPYRRIHHGQQRGRHLHEWYAAHIRRGYEARQVADHPPAQSHDGGVAAAPLVDHPVGERAPLLACLVPLTRWNGAVDDALRSAKVPQRAHQMRPVKTRDLVIGNDRDRVSGRDLARDATHRIQEPWRHMHAVAEDVDLSARDRAVRCHHVTSPAPAR